MVSLNVLVVALAMLINAALIFLLCLLIARWRRDKRNYQDRR
jgi:hypothetical protein